MARLIFLTHPEVVIDPNMPVPAWPLSAVGRWRAARFATWCEALDLAAVYSSDEQKAVDGGQIIASHRGVPHWTDAALGENDRSSTGYVAPPRFWEIVESFFARPDESVLGWETARAAQARILGAVQRANAEAEPRKDLVIVSHGGVGRLLAAALSGVPIGQESQPGHSGGGCWLEIDRADLTIIRDWQAIEDPPA